MSSVQQDSFWTSEDKIPISQKSVSIPSSNGLEYKGGQSPDKPLDDDTWTVTTMDYNHGHKRRTVIFNSKVQQKISSVF